MGPMADPACRLLTLVGVGGIGKTRLALHAATEMSGDFRHGVYWVSLASTSAADRIDNAISDVLNVSFMGKEDLSTQLIDYLRDKEMLLVLDNIEHLLDGVRLLSEILGSGPKVKILVTSRERLSLQEEWAVLIEGLTVPDKQSSIQLSDVERYDAIRLFIQSARRTQPRFSIATDFNAVANICQAVEGMPLAIELAANWLRILSCSQIAVQIRGNLNLLEL